MRLETLFEDFKPTRRNFLKLMGITGAQAGLASPIQMLTSLVISSLLRKYHDDIDYFKSSGWNAKDINEWLTNTWANEEEMSSGNVDPRMTKLIRGWLINTIVHDPTKALILWNDDGGTDLDGVSGIHLSYFDIFGNLNVGNEIFKHMMETIGRDGIIKFLSYNTDNPTSIITSTQYMRELGGDFPYLEWDDIDEFGKLLKGAGVDPSRISELSTNLINSAADIIERGGSYYSDDPRVNKILQQRKDEMLRKIEKYHEKKKPGTKEPRLYNVISPPTVGDYHVPRESKIH